MGRSPLQTLTRSNEKKEMTNGHSTGHASRVPKARHGENSHVRVCTEYPYCTRTWTIGARGRRGTEPNSYARRPGHDRTRQRSSKVTEGAADGRHASGIRSACVLQSQIGTAASNLHRLIASRHCKNGLHASCLSWSRHLTPMPTNTAYISDIDDSVNAQQRRRRRYPYE